MSNDSVVSNDGLRFCALPEVPDRVIASNISLHRAGLIQMIGKKWVNGTHLRYYFFDEGPYAADKAQLDMVRDGFRIWENVGIGLTFEEVKNISESEIRIGFLQGDGAWSYVGRDVIDVPGQFERTMNFGWNITQDRRGVDVAVHEIGHTLGFSHEHQNPFSGIEWDENAVLSYFSGPPNNWPPERTRYNILRKFHSSEVQGSVWDPNSIMHYGFPPGLIVKPEEFFTSGLTPQLGLSDLDKEQAKFFYPPLITDDYPRLRPFQPKVLSLDPGEQANYLIKPSATREYTIRTFGLSDTLMVLFENQDDDLRFLDGEDDSGTDENSTIKVRLFRGREYILRIRLYLNYSTSTSIVMMY